MRFPEYSRKEFPPSDMPLSRAYMQAIGEYEEGSKRRSASKKGGLWYASTNIGQACVRSLTDYEGALGQMGWLRRQLREYAPNSSENERQAAMLIRLTSLLLSDRQPIRHPRLRKAMHGQAVIALSQIGQELEAVRRHDARKHSTERNFWFLSELRGEQAHYRAQSTLSRARHPWFLPMPSLLHHDQHDADERQQNFDQALIEYGAHTPSPLLHKLQIKNGCFGLCERETGPDKKAGRQEWLKTLRAQYDPDITLISGCCDFQFENSGIDPTIHDTLLDQEWRGEIDKAGRHRLNRATSHVLYIATHGEEIGRNGTFGLAEVSQITPSS